jgi:formylglycine-generating enzyme required for sulfatase activity
MCKSCRGFHHVLIERGSATDARVGQRVQDYVLLKKLGEGAMGTTFLAALPSEVEVALKLPKEGTSLEREADMLLRVQHCPHVAHLRDRSPEGAWLALDYIEGQTLERLLTTHTLGDAAVRKALLLELVKLLSEIHKVGVVHRDFNPSNIILRRRADGGWLPFLVDFGVAMAIGEDRSQLTRAGTPPYRAPEGADEVGQATDVYALALIVAEVLSGERAHATHLGPEHLGVLGTHLPPRLRDIVRKGLALQPGQRPSLAALEESLQAALAAGPQSMGTLVDGPGDVPPVSSAAPTLAPPGPVPVREAPREPPPGRWERRWWIGCGGLALGVLAVGLLGWQWRQAADARDGFRAEAQAAERRAAELAQQVEQGKVSCQADVEAHALRVDLERAHREPGAAWKRLCDTVASGRMSAEEAAGKLATHAQFLDPGWLEWRQADCPQQWAILEVVIRALNLDSLEAKGRSWRDGVGILLSTLMDLQEVPAHAQEARRQWDRVTGWMRSRLTSARPRLTWVALPAGSFGMGCSPDDLLCDPDEQPAHEVALDAFWLGQTEVTCGQYKAFDLRHDCARDADPAQTELNEQTPARGISWYSAVAFAAWVGARLPTEAEWEYAARAGSRSAWAHGPDAERLRHYAWTAGSAGRHKIHPVGSRCPNGWGLDGMSGGVAEWTWDRLASYEKGRQENPRGPKVVEETACWCPQEIRVLRGGSAWSCEQQTRVSFRDFFWPERRADHGLRLASSQRPPP